MHFNLLKERWIPVRRRDGSIDRIAPPGVVDPDIVDLRTPRPDFDAALREFLIGLLQTAMPPVSEGAWEKALEHPPAEDELRQAFARHEPFFELLGERPLFMQDLTMNEAEKPKTSSVAALLIEQPGGNTLKNNGDLFVKRDKIKTLCPACAAMALFTLQAFAPSGGKGHRTSLRGGGPLSTLLQPRLSHQGQEDSLWTYLWANVLPVSFGTGGKAAPKSEKEWAEAVYPWAAPTRTSDKNEQTHPEDVHFLHAYWAMPRRIVLLPEEAHGTCDLCDSKAETVFRNYQTRPYGYNYGPTWQHPLTPYRITGNDAPLSIKGQSNTAGYNHWLGIVYRDHEDTSAKKPSFVRPAACVEHGYAELGADGDCAVHVAGFNMDNMKAVQWCEANFPVYGVKGDMAEFRFTVDAMIRAADQVRRNLVAAVREALVNEAGHNHAGAEKTLLATAGNSLWAKTEADFYRLGAELAQMDDYQAIDGLKVEFAKVLENAAQKLFHDQVARFRVQPERMARQVEAMRKMRNYNRKALEKTLALPKKEAK